MIGQYAALSQPFADPSLRDNSGSLTVEILCA
jgi:hypothetical protein